MCVTTNHQQNVQKLPYMEVFKLANRNILWSFLLLPLLVIPFGVWDFSDCICTYYALA